MRLLNRYVSGHLGKSTKSGRKTRSGGGGQGDNPASLKWGKGKSKRFNDPHVISRHSSMMNLYCYFAVLQLKIKADSL